ncbi:ribonuclease T2 family protein [Terrihabitans sp. B22-R8]|uniref:ribonuclease T2 family protein n=1 Tax=Terrihabitans sp. B22-R8 TaxID=3425128 RepID=UPI00403C9E38
MLRRLVLAVIASLFAGTALARDNVPGAFDFYVLSLSWSPTYCLSDGADRKTPQCAGERPFAFVVHGLWPQHETGYPQNCNRSAPRVPQSEIDAMLDIMPSPGLVIHQWRRHGTCSGLSSKDYFQITRTAHSRVTIPETFRNVADWRTLSPGEIEKAFLAANDGLKPDAIAVTCRSRRVQEVRICMDRDKLGFRSCPDVDTRACRADKVTMPPVRAGRD